MKYIILDTETTGIGEADKIIQLAYLVADEDNNVELFQTYCTPDLPIGYLAMSVHHITPEMIEGAPKLTETKEYENLLELNKPENFIVIQNSDFDLKMLEKEGFENKMKVIDTLRIARNVLPESEAYSEQYLRYYLGLYKKEKEIQKKFGIKEIAAHDAIGDILVLKLLFDYFLENHTSLQCLQKIPLMSDVLDKNRMNFNDLMKYHPADRLHIISQIPALQSKFKFGKYKDKSILKVIEKDRQYVEWMVNKMDNLNESLRFTLNFYLWGDLNELHVNFPEFSQEQEETVNEEALELPNQKDDVEQISLFDLFK